MNLSNNFYQLIYECALITEILSVACLRIKMLLHLRVRVMVYNATFNNMH